MSSAAGLLFSPIRTLEEFTADAKPSSVWRMLRRPALVALTFGVAVAMTTTGRVEPRLVASTTLYWSFIPLAQLLIAWAVIVTAASRTLPITRAVDIYFALNLPWSLWILAFAAWSAAGPPTLRPNVLVLLTLVVPCIWTWVLLYAFCVTVLRDAVRAALWRTALHQILTWSIFVAYYGWAVALWPHVIGWLS